MKKKLLVVFALTLCFALSLFGACSPEKPTYAVTLTQSSGGTISADVETVKEGGSVTITITPNVNYALEFLKINNDPVDVTGNTYIVSNVTEDIAVTVSFVDTRRYVSYDLNYVGAEVITDKTLITDGMTLIADPDRYAFSFSGWYEGTTFVDSAYLSSLIASPRNVTLTAHWDAIVYDVTLSFNDGVTSDVETSDVAYGSSYSQINGWVETPELNGKTFLGWYLNGDKVVGDDVMTELDIEESNVITAKWRDASVYIDAEVSEVTRFGSTIEYYVDPINKIENNNSAILSIYNYSENTITALNNSGNSALKIETVVSNVESLGFTYNHSTNAGDFMSFDMYVSAPEEELPTEKVGIEYGIVYGGWDYAVNKVYADVKYNEWFKVVAYIGDGARTGAISSTRGAFRFNFSDLDGYDVSMLAIYVDNLQKLPAAYGFNNAWEVSVLNSAISTIDDVSIREIGGEKAIGFTFRGVNANNVSVNWVKFCATPFTNGDIIEFDMYIDISTLSEAEQTTIKGIDPVLYTGIYRTDNISMASLFHNGNNANPTFTTISDAESSSDLYGKWVHYTIVVGNGSGYTGTFYRAQFQFDNSGLLKDFAGNITFYIDNLEVSEASA